MAKLVKWFLFMSVVLPSLVSSITPSRFWFGWALAETVPSLVFSALVNMLVNERTNSFIKTLKFATLILFTCSLVSSVSPTITLSLSSSVVSSDNPAGFLSDSYAIYIFKC